VSCLFLFYLALAVGQATSPPTPQQIPQSESSVQTGSHADISILRTKAEAGDAVAQFQLGKAYETGNGTPQNDELAVNWYRKAAEQGNPAAENSLGVMFRLGRGVEKNQEEAVRWYRKAAKLGSPEAMFNLGAAHYNGDGTLSQEDLILSSPNAPAPPGVSPTDSANGFHNQEKGTYKVNADCTGTFTINFPELTNPTTGATTPGAIIIASFVLSDHGRAIHAVVTSLTPPGAPGPVPALILSESHKLGHVPEK